MKIHIFNKFKFIQEKNIKRIPDVVLKDVVHSHGIEVQSDYGDYIHYVKDVICSWPPDSDTLRLLARYMNPRCIWNKKSLIEAYFNEQRFRKREYRDRLHLTSLENIGLPTPTMPNSLSSCILYLLLQDNQIECNSQMTEFMMFEILLKVKHIGNPTSHSDFGSSEASVAETGNPCSVNLNLELSEIESCKLLPLTSTKAIILGAFMFQCNLLQAFHPIKQYTKLVENKKTTDTRITYFKDTFSPEFPLIYYETETLNVLSEKNGITKSFLPSEMYLKLVQNYTEPTFYHGKHAFTLMKETLISCSKISELDYDECVSYGTLTSHLLIYEYSELLSLFLAYRNFMICDQNGLFILCSREVSKLKSLCLTNKAKRATNTTDICSKLLTCIINIEKYKRSEMNSSLQFCTIFQQADELDKEYFNEALTLLNELAMYMRGWDGKSEFPISNLAPIENFNSTELNITLAFIKFDLHMQQRCELGKIILSLPLLRYIRGQYCISNESITGLTISDRLEIIKHGTSDQSCIRISSNWLASTAYYYMYSIGCNVQYEIDDLENIV